MAISTDVRKRLEEDALRIDRGDESYGALAKRYDVTVADVYRIRQEQLQRRTVDEAKDALNALHVQIRQRREELEALDDAYDEKKRMLEGEMNQLLEQKRQVLVAFERQGLSWEEGVQLLKDVQNLRGESDRAKKEITKHTMTRLRLEKEIKHARSSLRQLKTQLSELRQIITVEEERFKTLIRKILSRQDNLRRLTDAIEEKEKTLRDSVKEYEDTIHKQKKYKAALQAELRSLMKDTEEQKAVSQAEIRDLMEKATRLKSTIKTLSEKVNMLNVLKSKIVQETEERAESIVASSEQEKTRNLKWVEDLRKEIEILEAEKALAESAVRLIIKELREERKRVEEAEAS